MSYVLRVHENLGSQITTGQITTGRIGHRIQIFPMKIQTDQGHLMSVPDTNVDYIRIVQLYMSEIDNCIHHRYRFIDHGPSVIFQHHDC